MNERRLTAMQRRRCATCGIITITIILLFFIFAFGAYKMSRAPHTDPNMLLSNGTNDFAPTTILISLDGFRADFLTRGITPTLNQFIAEGVSPKYMYPSFPSLTFPNHFSIVTGLYPESHGIVGNTFFDPIMAEEFHYGEAEHSMQPKWWAGGEPIWVTAEKENVVTGIHMWPGSEAGMDYSPTYVDKFNGSELLSRKTARILELIDLPDFTSSTSTPRPQLIAAYVPVVDTAGHAYGPNSTEIMDTISDVDTMLHNIFISLGERNLTDIVNVIVVSDHGMATTSTDRLIQLDDIIDMSQIEHSDGWPLNGLRPKDPAHIKSLYDTLKAEADNNPNFDVYLRDEDMPNRFHFQHNERIAPLWIVPKVGWAIVPKKDFDVAKAKEQGTPYDPKGLHGYDNEDPLMRAIFVARGPAFPHEPNSRIDPFQNTEVYNILCDTLGLEPKPNNGTIRLPFKTTGVHGDGGQGDDEGEPPEDLPGGDEPAPETDEGDESKEDAADDTESQAGYKNFWSYMKAKLHKAMDWAHGMVEKLKNPKNKNPSAEEDGP